MFALQFPGQGAQSEGFLHRLPDRPAVRATLEEASQTLACDVLTLDSASALRSTVAVQIGLVVAGVAIVRALADEGLAPDISAGLSVGAFAAAVSCGALSFPNALRLVRKRAELMEAAYPHGYGLAAISGLNEAQIERLAADQMREGAAPVYIGNVNAPRQIVMAGANDALSAFVDRARAAGARKATPLDVSVPSHCELLADAAEELLGFAAHLPFEAPKSVYIGNRGGRPLYTADAIRGDLAGNMRHTVRWYDGLTAMVELGARVLLEAPPGQVLTDIAHEEFPDITSIAAANIAFDRLVATLHRRLSADG
jgi:malonate decarboxylase epsilon subunit